MRRGVFWLCVGALALPSWALGQALPPDVRADHWAASAVTSVLTNKVMRLTDGKQFHGDAKVTRTEAIIAIANLARLLEAQQWKTKPSNALVKRAEVLVDQTDWKSQPVTRFAFAKVIARSGDYFTNAMKRGAPNSKDRAKSVAIPARGSLKVPTSHPAYASLSYLISKNALWSNSPLLLPDDKPVAPKEVSTALAQMLAGMNNIVTDLGKEPDGSTPDPPSIKRRKSQP